MIAQVQWVQAMLLLGAVCGFARRQQIVVLTACVLSGFFFVNSVFTWPKLLSAWLFLVALAALLEATGADRTARRRQVVLAGGLAGLAVLAHPGVVFTLLALPLLFRWRPYRAWLDPVALGGALCLFLSCVTPWLVYQQRVDPPANRVARIHLAGDHSPGERNVVSAVRDAYRSAPVGTHLAHRARNVAAQFWSHDVHRGLRIRIQQLQFFHHVPALGILVIGIVLSMTRPAPPGERAIRHLAGLALFSVLVWIVVMFEGGAAVVHHGSYATTALLFFVGAVGLTRLPWCLTLGLLGAHALLFALVWLPAFGA
jgi:hypothetical protein